MFLKMSECTQLDSHTLERFALRVPVGATSDRIEMLALSATHWGAYRAIVCRAARASGERLAPGAALSPRALAHAFGVADALQAPAAEAALELQTEDDADAEVQAPLCV